MSHACICVTTTNREKEARKLASMLVEHRLAACVQMIPKVTSFYEWDGALQEDAEQVLLIKTTRERAVEVRELIMREHSYELPEFMVLDVADGSAPYLLWLEKSVRPKVAE